MSYNNYGSDACSDERGSMKQVRIEARALVWTYLEVPTTGRP